MIFKKKVFLSILAGIFVLTAGCTAQTDKQNAGQAEVNKRVAAADFKWIPVKNEKVQIRGIGYPGNDHSLYVATDTGLKFYSQSKWMETSSNPVQYIDFQATEKGFIASGHPEKGIGLKDPLGLIESSDKGKSFNKLAFYGTGNFLFISSSFFGNGLYLINNEPDTKLDSGVYYSENDGKNWLKSQFKNFHADSLGMIAVHPKEGNVMSIATRTGIYYSNDYGNTLEPVTTPDMITAQTFLGDDILYSSAVNQNIYLRKVNPKTGEQTDLVIPFLDYNNPITYIAVDPRNQNKWAFSTYNNDLYESTDGGKNWNNLITNGKIEQD